ncbi:hypothetical protein HOLleu_01262 [Holothuria leucospilota]|uniref:Transposable element P transposase-like GTP-binding insertion domain-containing protein n=1 Tax=Holothuria leucospilota TaxID=206669 RepID=A0A9Q1HKQ9_HOLLE|nr:hypothetical protein HOLleu_01262 [Holothuria leucospilota]
MSQSVANGLQMMNRPEFSSTIHFITMVDKFFDCLNVSNTTDWQNKRKDNLKPYAAVDNARFVWLKNDFLGFLDKWIKESQEQPNLTAKEKNCCMSE